MKQMTNLKHLVLILNLSQLITFCIGDQSHPHRAKFKTLNILFMAGYQVDFG